MSQRSMWMPVVEDAPASWEPDGGEEIDRLVERLAHRWNWPPDSLEVIVLDFLLHDVESPTDTLGETLRPLIEQAVEGAWSEGDDIPDAAADAIRSVWDTQAGGRADHAVPLSVPRKERMHSKVLVTPRPREAFHGSRVAVPN